MGSMRIVAQAFDGELNAGFESIRADLGIPQTFPPEVLAEAVDVARRGPIVPAGASPEVVDRTDLALLTIDPPGSTDLDQAFAAETIAGGFRIWYAIADLACFVRPDGALDVEARQRGVTMYSPDQRSSLHPEALNETPVRVATAKSCASLPVAAPSAT